MKKQQKNKPYQKQAFYVIIVLLSIGAFWYVNQPVEGDIALGKEVYDKNCAVCHGIAGVGLVKDWKKPLPDGSYPPPPLNGTAHTWHHSPTALLQTINNGGAKIGGKMPAFKGKLSDVQKQSLIDYLYDLWPEDIQKRYDEHFK